jgi:hypothetical protein
MTQVLEFLRRSIGESKMKYLKYITGCLLLSNVLCSNVQAATREIKKNEFIPCSTVEIDLNKISESGRVSPSNTNTGHQIKVPDGAEKIVLEELDRKRVIASDMETLVNVFKKVVKNADEKSAGIQNNDDLKECIDYTQGRERATLKVTASIKDQPTPINYSLAVGPAEHWYFSADLAVTKAKQLSYDADKRTLVEKDKPQSFYLGVNYKIGDLFTSYSGSSAYKNLSVKTLFKVSSKPTDSMGIGLEYNFKKINIFVAQLSTKGDSGSSPVPVGRNRSTIVGISLPIGKALEWLD